MLSLVQQNSGWLSDVRSLIDVGAALAVLLSGAIGFRVYMLLFNLKILDRLITLETQMETVREDIKDLKKKAFGV